MQPTQPPLTLRDAIRADELRDIAADTILGIQQIGQKNANRAASVPVQTIAMAPLHHDADLLFDVWVANAPCVQEQFEDVRISHNDDVLFGAVEIDRHRSAPESGESMLRAATDAAYRRLFAALRTKGFPHLWRTWNYIPDIHAEEAGLERYRQFNIGRHQAFEAARLAAAASPAASALGTRDGPLSIAFVAGRTAPQRIENPRQVRAYDYPSQYGPRSPAFSRATTIAAAAQRLLFVSGTASIVGHETLHAGDVVAQTRESVANIAALLAQANAASAAAISLQDLSYRVYIRDAGHGGIVARTLGALLGDTPRALYVQADICREDLLVEIEAYATAAADVAP